MSGFTHGMNQAVVRDQAVRIDGVVQRLQTVSRDIDGVVAALGQQWSGQDLVRFQGWWQQEHRPAIANMTEEISGLAQSARNNSDEQDRASGTVATGSDEADSAVGPPAGSGDAGRQNGGSSNHVVMGNRSIAEVQREYDAWATGGFANPNISQYQCTGWANFRWAELGYDGPPIRGNGWEMAGNAPGELSNEPSLHAMASYGSGVEGNFGHVMIVEELGEDSSWIRVSEMNVGDGDPYVATPDEYRDTRVYNRGADGVFRNGSGKELNFASLPS